MTMPTHQRVTSVTPWPNNLGYDVRLGSGRYEVHKHPGMIFKVAKVVADNSPCRIRGVKYCSIQRPVPLSVLVGETDAVLDVVRHAVLQNQWTPCE